MSSSTSTEIISVLGTMHSLALTVSKSSAFFNICTPYPGTELYEKALKGNGIKLVTRDWKEFKRWGNAVIELDDISRDELIKFQKQAMQEFYIRPRIIWDHLKKYLDGERDAYYYRPLISAFKHYFNRG